MTGGPSLELGVAGPATNSVVHNDDPEKLSLREGEFKRGPYFWAILIGLGITNLLGALENTVVSTSAPVILTDLQFGENYIWITNSFFVCSAAFQPLFGQLCNIFGRRWVTLLIVASTCSSVYPFPQLGPLLTQHGDSLHTGERYLRRSYNQRHAHRRKSSAGHRIRGNHHGHW